MSSNNCVVIKLDCGFCCVKSRGEHWLHAFGNIEVALFSAHPWQLRPQLPHVQPAPWGVKVGMKTILPDVDIVIVIIHVNVNISSDCFVTDKFAVAIGMLYPALCVISCSLVAVYELALSSITVNDNITELLVTEIPGEA